MAMQGGFGLDLKITTAGLTTVGNLFDCEFPVQEQLVVDATCHDETSGYKVFMSTGLRVLQPFTAVLGWDVGETEHAAIMTAFDADAAVAMSIEDPAGAEVIAFSAFVTNVKRISAAEDVYKAEVTFQPTAGPTIT